MDTIPVWRTPHDYALVPIEGIPHPGVRDVFTYGPVFWEFLRGWRKPKRLQRVEHLATYVGLEWLGSLADALRAESDLCDDKQSPLTRWLEDEYRLQPGQAANPGGLLGEPKRRTPVPRSVLRSFLDQDGERISTRFVKRLVQPAALPLLEAARNNSPPINNGGWTEFLKRELGLASVPLQVKSYRVGDAAKLGYSFANLRDRILVELLEQYTDAPPLRLCRACKLPFTPRRPGDHYCRRGVWSWQRLTLEVSCIPDELEARLSVAFAAQARRQEYKARKEALRRLRLKVGIEHPDYLAAQQTHDEWATENPSPRRPGKPKRVD